MVVRTNLAKYSTILTGRGCYDLHSTYIMGCSDMWLRGTGETKVNISEHPWLNGSQTIVQSIQFASYSLKENIRL